MLNTKERVLAIVGVSFSLAVGILACGVGVLAIKFVQELLI